MSRLEFSHLTFLKFISDTLSRVSAATGGGKATWTGTLKGVDWKSLCFPASLPLTIHYFPDHKVRTRV